MYSYEYASLTDGVQSVTPGSYKANYQLTNKDSEQHYTEIMHNSKSLFQHVGTMLLHILSCAAVLLCHIHFFTEANVNDTKYLDVLKKYIFVQLEEEGVLMFQHNGAPHYGNTVYDERKVRFPNHWI
jgi:hypothetical protein